MHAERIPAEAKADREPLRHVMAQAGSRPLRSEYRHFNYKGYRRGRLRHNGYRAVE